jgi:enoyl-CoA hydratase/carnithine racemase
MSKKFGEHISVRFAGHVAEVVIDRPPHNHVSVELLSDLADAFDTLDRDPACRAIVLATEGKAFCAGADLASKADGVDADSTVLLYEQAARLFAAETPIVAAVQGAAVGAGLGLALVADLRVAAPEARFAANFVKIGFHPGFGISHTLPRLIGANRAQLMLLTGRRVKAEDALAWGLVDEVVPLERVRDAAHVLAAEIAENAPLAVVSTRKTLRGDLADAVRAMTAHEHKEQTWLRATEDYAEGLKAVAERRVGNFAAR